MRTPSFAATTAVVLCALVPACGPSEDERDEAPDARPAAEAAEPSGPADSSADASGSLLDPNEASGDRLASLPHFDASLADALVAGRPYADMLEVDAVLAERLSEEQREEVYGRLFKPLDLNAASGAEILLIPGVGERMEHEFEEYRPYRGIEEFRREIGKYVDEAGVRRLEQYVTLAPGG